MNTIKTQAQQTLLDIAIQCCGALDALFDVAKLNGMSPTGDIEAGTVLMVPNVLDKKVASTFGNMRHKPATALTDEEGGDLRVFDQTFSTVFE